MPFGKKPILGQPDRTFDFDKVYRVIMRRAIEAAGMVPVRADESTASGVIHTDMFKALRDKGVVLAELSLHNPNVYYELGIRHVLSSTGTVLMCQADQQLPFDIALSRAVLYDYDGDHLDWEEAERVIPILRQYLLDAQQGYQDSPVHALIHIPGARSQAGSAEPASDTSRDLDVYSEDLGRRWRSEGRELSELMDAHARSVFGARAIGAFCLADEPLPEGSQKAAAHLVDSAQYDLANRILEKLGDELDPRQRVMYASSYSEAHPNVAGADWALELIRRTVEEVLARSGPESPTRTRDLVHCFRREAALTQWRWQLTQEPDDLEAAITTMGRALDQMLEARRQGLESAGAGLIAQMRVKMMLLLRIRDGDSHRPDAEGHGDAVLTMTTDPTIDDDRAISWLGWYRVLVVADRGNETEARERTFDALRFDAGLNQLEYWEIGRRQYHLLRRFMDQYAEWFREPTVVGTVAQALQARIDR